MLGLCSCMCSKMRLGSNMANHIPWPRMQGGSSKRVGPWSASRAGQGTRLNGTLATSACLGYVCVL